MRHHLGTAMMLLVTTATAVASYTVNLKVSAERSAVRDLHYRLVSDARRMRELQAELRTRARLPEMQRWNDMVLHMSAPAAHQYLRSPVQLASFAATPEAAAGNPVIRYAVTGAQPVAPPAAPVVRAAYVPAPPATIDPVVRAAYRPAPARDLAADLAPSLEPARLDAATGKGAAR